MDYSYIKYIPFEAADITSHSGIFEKKTHQQIFTINKDRFLDERNIPNICSFPLPPQTTCLQGPKFIRNQYISIYEITFPSIFTVLSTLGGLATSLMKIGTVLTFWYARHLIRLRLGTINHRFQFPRAEEANTPLNPQAEFKFDPSDENYFISLIDQTLGKWFGNKRSKRLKSIIDLGLEQTDIVHILEQIHRQKVLEKLILSKEQRELLDSLVKQNVIIHDDGKLEYEPYEVQQKPVSRKGQIELAFNEDKEKEALKKDDKP